MIALVTDPDSKSASYFEGLNICFPGWGGVETFDWCFRRSVGGPAADLLVVEEEGRLIAGSAVVYRRALRRGGKTPERIAIMSGSWTLPEARGRGIFKGMIQASRDRAAEQGCALLIAFAHDENPSARALAAAGALVTPAFYLASQGPVPEGGQALQAVPDREACFAERSIPDGTSRVFYEGGEWRSQIVLRPRPTESLSLPGGLLAICERGPGTARLLDVSATDAESFAAAAIHIAAQKSVTAYSNDEAAAALLVKAGFANRPGGVYLLGTGDEPARPERWRFANGDRM